MMNTRKRFTFGASIAVAMWMSVTTGPAQENQLKTLKEKVSYGIGLDIGTTFKKQNMDINLEVLVSGLKDGTQNRQPLLTADEVKEVMTAYSNRMNGPTPTPAAGAPSDEIVQRGANKLFGDSVAKGGFRRGDTLISGGKAGVPRGTTLYPMKFGDMPTVYYLKDEFGDWKAYVEGLETVITIGR